MTVSAPPDSACPAGTSDSARLSRLGLRVERLIAWCTEVPAAILLVAEVLLLMLNVICRYLLHEPLSWTDELSSLLFLWLAMLGAVIALRKGQHMCLTTVLGSMRPSRRAFLHTFGDVTVFVFVLLLVVPAWRYVVEERAITTPALEISNGFRVAAIAVGVSLMLALALVRLMERARLADVLKAATLMGILAGLIYFGRDHLIAWGNLNLLLFFLGGVTALALLGIPIMVAFGLSTLAYLAAVTEAPLIIAVGRIDAGMSSLILLSVPLFVLLGGLVEATGMAAAMIRLLSTLVGHHRGGLSYVLIGAMYLVSGISGSKAADMAAVAPALFPEMKRRGVDEGEMIALLSSTGAMSETVPPSLVLITMGAVTGVSIASLFTAGLLPAALGALALAAVVWNRQRKVPGGGARATPAQTRAAFWHALPALVLPFVIRAAVVNGVATATEVATIGIAYSAVLGQAYYRQFSWRRLYPMLVGTASLSGAILMIIGCATAMAWALTQSGFSEQLAALMAGVPGGAAGFMLVSVVMFVLLGSFLEGIPAIVLFAPLFFPMARHFGIHEVHYAILAVFAMGLGLFAPPFGVGFYAACAIGEVSPERALPRVWPYLGALLLALLLVALIPWLSTGFLPTTL
ncbi:TRAP transporter large permease subunit [Duganella sp. Dugasp56]|uniref:TRAP transporter large permease n=1 Tax=Duganella sp. Dugasp56 TaxID=3243046 RepID=UPI0039B02CDD